MQKDENGTEFTETPFESGEGHLSAAELGEGSTVFLMSQAEENTYYSEGQLIWAGPRLSSMKFP